MNGFAAFLSKELTQVLRNKQLFIVAAVFLLLGLMNAPLAKYTPLILELAGMGDFGDSLGMSEPQAFDAWAQFVSNMGQMGVLAILLVCGGTLSGEKSKGTLILPLTRGLGRMGVVLIKFLVISALWTIGFLIAALSSLAYTALLFPGDTATNLAWMLFLFWLFVEFLLALVPLSSVLFKGSMSGLIIPGGVLFILLVLTAFPDLFAWNPMLLGTSGINVMAGIKEPIDFLAPGLCAVIAAIASVTVAVVHFRKAAV